MPDWCRIAGKLAFRTAVVGVTVYGGYVGISGLRTRDWILAVGGTTALTIGALIGTALLIRGWLIEHSSSVRRDLEVLAAERRALDAASRVVAREKEVTQMRILGVERRLDETLTALTAERREHAATRNELKELTDEHNALIRETLQAGFDRFAQPTEAPSAGARQRARFPGAAARGDHE
ncbi:hypothetical protein [Streptomyces sp. NPDC092952]|uniref:hypothetical protein n=1 Tax=Streptomyces sp. NPDC092952 TaxID=3366018 RepID=UPI003824ED2D